MDISKICITFKCMCIAGCGGVTGAGRYFDR